MGRLGLGLKFDAFQAYHRLIYPPLTSRRKCARLRGDFPRRRSIGSVVVERDKDTRTILCWCVPVLSLKPLFGRPGEAIEAQEDHKETRQLLHLLAEANGKRSSMLYVVNMLVVSPAARVPINLTINHERRAASLFFSVKKWPASSLNFFMRNIFAP